MKFIFKMCFLYLYKEENNSWSGSCSRPFSSTRPCFFRFPLHIHIHTQPRLSVAVCVLALETSSRVNKMVNIVPFDRELYLYFLIIAKMFLSMAKIIHSYHFKKTHTGRCLQGCSGGSLGPCVPTLVIS